MALVSIVIPLTPRLVPTTKDADSSLRGRLVYAGRMTIPLQLAANRTQLTAGPWTMPPSYSYMFESLNAGVAATTALGQSNYDHNGSLEFTNARIESEDGDVEFYHCEDMPNIVGATGIPTSSWRLEPPAPVGVLQAPPDLVTTGLWSTYNDHAAEQVEHLAYFRISFLIFDTEWAERFPLGAPIPLISQ